jgi:hypothetical protein
MHNSAQKQLGITLMVSLLLTIMMMLTIPSVGNTNLFNTNTANAQEDYNDDKYGYYYYPPDDYKYECQKVHSKAIL